MAVITFSIKTLSIVALDKFADRLYAECHYKCRNLVHFAEHRYAECHGALQFYLTAFSPFRPRP